MTVWGVACLGSSYRTPYSTVLYPRGLACLWITPIGLKHLKHCGKMAPCLYDVLGVKPSATGEEVRRAYRRLAGKLHPDKHSDNTAHTKTLWTSVQEAYNILGDDGLRELYDSFGIDAVQAYEEVHRLTSAAGIATTIPPVFLVTFILIGGGALAALLSGFVLLCAVRYDGFAIPMSISWPVLFLPILLALPLITALSALASADSMTTFRLILWRRAPKAGLLFGFLIMLSLRLEQVSAEIDRGLFTNPSFAPMPWLLVLSPLLISRGMALAALPRKLHSWQQALATSQFAQPIARGDSPRAKAARECLWLLMSVLQLSLLPPILDGTLRLSWHDATWPSRAWIGIEMIVVMTTCCAVDHRPSASLPDEKLRGLWRQVSRCASVLHASPTLSVIVASPCARGR